MSEKKIGRFAITPETEVGDEPIFEQNLVLTKTTVENLEKILYPLMERRNILLVGDAGIGKNALVYYINKLRNLPTVRFSFNQDTLPEDLVGAFRILPDGFHWQNGPLAEAMINGYTFVADEMNLAAPEILKRFTSVLDRRVLSMLEKDGTEIQAHSRFTFIATQNPTRGFEGRKILPESIRKLFTIVYLQNYPLEEEIEIIQGLFPEADSALAEKVVRLQRLLESKVWKDEIAKEDLEHYHFNLRTAQRFFGRFSDLRRVEEDSPEVASALFDFYVDTFRQEKDREKALKIVSEIFRFDKEALRDLYAHHHSYEPPVIPPALDVSDDGASLDPFPLTRNRLRVMESIKESLTANENLLLEGSEAVRLAELARESAAVAGQPYRWITLSKGMHTSEIIGALRPVSGEQTSVRWVDGPLTEALRKQEWVILDNIEAAGSELIEKLNMLLDHAATLALPPEAEGERVVKREGESRVIAIKRHRKSRNQSTVSRAFRNRFFNLHVNEANSEDELRESAAILFAALFGDDTEPGPELINKMVLFHTSINEAVENKKIGLSLAESIRFLEENLLRWIQHVHRWMDSDNPLSNALITGLEVHYLSNLPTVEDREFGMRLWNRIAQDLPLDEWQGKLLDSRKKFQNKNVKKKLTWDPEKHHRLAYTGKAKPKFSGKHLKKGLRIDTPETGGEIKEGPDAWYGQDTHGNKGVGEPAGGGGAWGYKTEELFQAFLKKYKPKWDYDMGFRLKDFYEVFGKMLEDLEMDLENALDSTMQIERRLMSQGHRVESRKYLAYMAKRGSDRIFDHSRVIHSEDKLKGLEFAFFINKGRRLFNFEYSIASVVGLQSALEVLWDKKIPARVFGYSDLENFKNKIDLIEYTDGSTWEPPNEEQKEEIFHSMTDGWEGDTVEEYQVIQNLDEYFSPDATTRVVIMLSDFRGHRARQKIEDDLNKPEIHLLRELIHEYGKQNYIFFGIQTGTRYIAEHLFDRDVWINSENFDKGPLIIAEAIQEIILKYHQPQV